ncbi:MAG: GNAT family N-acetyltransferase [Myxococcales bacterium FL481]|nr:MAG: GNAT family N-acetyltransferase [Myxococcales bacterium FL481]
MPYVDLDESNIADQHICCAFGDPKHEQGVLEKKKWLKRRFAEGLVFRKLDVRGKVFIEYMPSELAWRPIEAPGFLTVHCLWVSGRYAKHGHGRALLRSCIDDARRQGKHGVVIASAKKKKAFLADPKFLEHLGFKCVDERAGFRLYACFLHGVPEASWPKFSPARKPRTRQPNAVQIYHSPQCPFNTHWVPLVAQEVEHAGFDVSIKRLTRAAQNRKVRSPLGAFSLESDEQLVAHCINALGVTRKQLAGLRATSA